MQLIDLRQLDGNVESEGPSGVSWRPPMGLSSLASGPSWVPVSHQTTVELSVGDSHQLDGHHGSEYPSGCHAGSHQKLQNERLYSLLKQGSKRPVLCDNLHFKRGMSFAVSQWYYGI